MSRPTGAADELERRRGRAARAVAGGESRRTAARVLGVRYKTVARRARGGRTPGGVAAKAPHHPEPGPPDAGLRTLEGPRPTGAEARGRHNGLWAAARVARPIEQAFGLGDHPGHVREVLRRRPGWAGQRPRRRARERDGKGVARWVGDEFPRVVRQARERKAYPAPLGEPGSFLTPTVRRAPAPRGKAPVLKARDRRDRRGAVRCVTPSPAAGRPGLYPDLLGHHVHGGGVVEFLAESRRRVGRSTVVWDRNQVHSQSGAVRGRRATRPDVVAEDLPGYVPDLNPDEGVWGWAKYGRPAGLAANDGDELWIVWSRS